MDGEFPSWTGEYSHGVAENTPWGYPALNNTSPQSGKCITEGNYGDFQNACPPSLQVPVARMQEILPEVIPSSSSSEAATAIYAHNGSMAFSPDRQTVPSGMTPDPIKYFKFSQHNSMENVKDDSEDYIERVESVMSNMDNSVNDQLASAQKQDLEKDNPSAGTSVMTNGMELEQKLLADMRKTPPIYCPPTESGAMEFAKNSFVPVDNEAKVQDGRDVIKTQETTINILSDDTKRSVFTPSQEFQQMAVIGYRDLLTEGSSLNDKVLDEARSFATKVCSLTQSKTTAETDVSCFTNSSCLSDDVGPVTSNMHEQCTDLNKQMSYVPSTASNSNGYEKDTSVLRCALPHSSHTTPKEHAQSCKNVSTGKYMDGQTKSCKESKETLHKPLSIPGHDLKCHTISSEPRYSSTSDSKQEYLVRKVKVKKKKTPALMHHFLAYVQTSVGISKTWMESKESNLVSKKEESRSNAKCTTGKSDVLTGLAEGSCTVDNTTTCSQSHFSSSDTNDASLTISYVDKETHNGRIIAPNVRAVGHDATAHYISQVQSRSLIISSSPETGVSATRKSVGSLQTSTDFFEKETAQLEPCKDHTTHHTQQECKLGLDCKSSCLLSSKSPPATMKKMVGCTFKRKNVLKMAKVFSTIQGPFKNLPEVVQYSGKNHKTKTEEMRSPLKNVKKSHHTAITVGKGIKHLRSRHAKIKENRCFRKKQKVKCPALVSDCGPNWCMNSSKVFTNHTGQDFKTSSDLQPNDFQKESSKASRLLECIEDTLKTEACPESYDIMSQSSAMDFHLNASNTLLKIASDSECKNDTDVTGSRKQSLWIKSSKENPEITEPNGDAGFELSLQSTVKTTGFHSGLTNAFYTEVETKKSSNPLKDVNVKASDKHLEEISEKHVGVKCESDAIALKHSAVQSVDRFTQYGDEDYVTTQNKDTCILADVVKSTKLAKKYIKCKYCSRSFRHISAYTVHQRIHTGDKPYRCKLCGKSFAQLSKLKSHGSVHIHSVTLPCPCCGERFSEKRDLVAHFTTHVKDLKRNDDTPCKSISRNTFPAECMQNIRKHAQDKLVSCKTCGKEFSASSQLAFHEKTHWPVKPYACSICAKSFNRINALKKHSRKHTGETPFSCSHCSLAFCDLPALRAHQLSKLCNRKQSCEPEGFLVSHGVYGEVNTAVFFKCRICKQHYQKWCQYTLHLQTHTKSSPYLCSVCGQSYKKDSEVKVHCRQCCQTSGEDVACGSSLSEMLHSDHRKCTNLKETSPSPSSVDELHKNSQTLRHLHTELLLPESSQMVKTSNLLEPKTVYMFNDDHVSASPTPSGVSCDSLNESLECAKTSPSLWNFKCLCCGQRYKRYRTLRLHMQTHTPAFRYVCGHCGRSFERWTNLWLHQRIHRRKGRRYSCPKCNLDFHLFRSYKTHLLQHAKERPYACPLCPKTFTHEEALHVHQCSFHQLARRLQGDVCASSLAVLVKHSLLHNGANSHQCLLCDRSFANYKSLQEHLKVHDNSSSSLPSIPSEPITFLHKCNRCKSSFSTGDLLYAHQICHTRDLRGQMCSNQSSKSTSVSLGGTRSSTSRSLLLSLDLSAIPKKTLFKYPDPDELYVPPHLSRSENLRIVQLDVLDKDLEQESSTDPFTPNHITGPSGQNISQEYSETAMMSDQPEALESQESVWSQNTNKIPALLSDTSDNFKHTASHTIPTQTPEYFETRLVLEEPTTTTVNPADNEKQDEIFECADCSEKLHSLIGLHKHYFLHAAGNTHHQISLKDVGSLKLMHQYVQ